METICPIFKLPYQIHLSRLASLIELVNKNEMSRKNDFFFLKNTLS